MSEQAPTILCVDDDAEGAEALKDYLTEHGFHVVTATNGVEAILQVQRRRPAAVILNPLMPRLGGLGALERFRRLIPEIVAILISGTPGMLEMVSQAGVSVAGTFMKPLDLTAILGVLRQAGVVPSRRPAPSPVDEVSSKVTPTGRARILVVDDEPEVREVLADHLQGQGFEVLGAVDGQEALRRISEFRPHIVLLDIAMPRLGGVETLRRIRALYRQTCVVMISGLNDVETARQTLAMGAADYLTKPVDYAYLDTVVEIHLLMAQFEAEARE